VVTQHEITNLATINYVISRRCYLWRTGSFGGMTIWPDDTSSTSHATTAPKLSVRLNYNTV